jgi:hypothetical protein
MMEGSRGRYAAARNIAKKIKVTKDINTLHYGTDTHRRIK